MFPVCGAGLNRHHPDYWQIKLSTKSFSTAAAELLAEGFANVRGTLVDADLSDIIAGEVHTRHPKLRICWRLWLPFTLSPADVMVCRRQTP